MIVLASTCGDPIEDEIEFEKQSYVLGEIEVDELEWRLESLLTRKCWRDEHRQAREEFEIKPRFYVDEDTGQVRTR